MIRSEVRLARAEITTEAGKAANAGKPLMAGVVLSFYAGGLFLLGLVYALALVIPLWSATLAIAILVVIVSQILISAGRQRLRKVHPKPEKTTETLKEDVQWLKDQTR